MTTLPTIALSVRQPWTWAIMHARKDVENRDWRRPNPGLKFRGPVAIHAASGMTRYEYDDAADFIRRIAGDCPAPHELVRGAIVGHVRIMDVIRRELRRGAGSREPIDLTGNAGHERLTHNHRRDEMGAMTMIKGFTTDDGVTHLIPKSVPCTVDASSVQAMEITAHDNIRNWPEFQRELAQLINKHSLEHIAKPPHHCSPSSSRVGGRVPSGDAVASGSASIPIMRSTVCQSPAASASRYSIRRRCTPNSRASTIAASVATMDKDPRISGR